MNERISVLTIPEAGTTPDGDIADRPVLRTLIGATGADWSGREVSVSVDVALEDAVSYVAVLVDGDGTARSAEGIGDDAVLEFTQTDHVRSLAAKAA